MSWRHFILFSLTVVSCASSAIDPSVIRMSMSQDGKLDEPTNPKVKDEGPSHAKETQSAPAQLTLAKIFQNNMVLQRAPQKARVFGFSPNIGAKVMAQMTTPEKMYYYSTTVVQGPVPGVGSWVITLDPMDITDPVTIKVVSHTVSLTLQNVLFGDVWICSGQSNMQFSVAQMLNGAQEAQDAADYPNIRLFTASKISSTTPFYDLQKVDEAWTVPSAATVSNAPWTYFSSVCWLYGKTIQQNLGYPIGLVASDWGGTPVEAWSSPDALIKCHSEDAQSHTDDEKVDNVTGPQGNSVLWNAMINPLIGMTIYGAVWYQGENDMLTPAHMNNYNCTFPTMIQDWRTKFNKASQQQTSSSFPFGFVQLAPNRPDPKLSVGFPDIRWHQTADTGVIPNPKMPNTFMAVAMDLPDFKSPWGSIHPRDKEDVGARLALAGLSQAYNKPMGQVLGPVVTKGQYFPPSTITLQYDTKYGGIQVKSQTGFEVYCKPAGKPDYAWYPITGITHTPATVSFNTPSACGGAAVPSAVRYAWRESPCPFKACAVYSIDNDLPAPPFIYQFTQKADGRIMLDV